MGLTTSTCQPPYTFTVPANSFSDIAGNVCRPEHHHIHHLGLTSGAASGARQQNRLWYNRPAAYWEEALPLGNGRLGAMVSGSVAVDTLQLNEDTFWGQSPNTNLNANARSVLKQVQDYIFAKDYVSAQKLAIPNWMSQASHGAQYQAVGCVLIGFPGHRYNDNEAGATVDARDAQAYVRDLDLSNAVATTSYIVNGVTYTREVFTSFDDNVTVMRIEASQPGRLDFNVCFAAPIKTNMAKLGEYKITPDGMIMASLVPAKTQSENVDNKLNCYTFIKVINDGGTQTASTTRPVIQQGLVAANGSAPSIEVSNATSATIIISSATNFVSYNDISADAKAKAREYIDTYLAKNKDYATTLADHTAKYSRQFGRVSLDLGNNPDQEVKDTERRIKEFYADSNDPGLVSNYFQFGRYLLISSSQPGSPAGQSSGHMEPQRPPVSRLGLQIHRQHQRRDELLARRGDQPLRVSRPVCRDGKRRVGDRCRDRLQDVRCPRMGAPSQHRPVAHHRCGRQRSGRRMAHMQRVVLLTLVGKVSFLGRQGLSGRRIPNAQRMLPVLPGLPRQRPDHRLYGGVPVQLARKSSRTRFLHHRRRQDHELLALRRRGNGQPDGL